MSFPYTGKLPSQLKVYDANADGNIVAMVIETENGEVMQTTPAAGGSGGGSDSVELDRVVMAFVNRSTSGWLEIGEPIPPNVEDFEVETNGVDRNTQNVVEVDTVGQRIRVEDSAPFVADLQKVTFTKLV